MRWRVTVVGSVCLSVCLSVKSHFTSGASVRSENTVTYSAGNGGQKNFHHCRDPALPLLKGPCICTVKHFPAESGHGHYSIYQGTRIILKRGTKLLGFCTLVHSFISATTRVIQLMCTSFLICCCSLLIVSFARVSSASFLDSCCCSSATYREALTHSYVTGDRVETPWEPPIYMYTYMHTFCMYHLLLFPPNDLLCPS